MVEYTNPIDTQQGANIGDMLTQNVRFHVDDGVLSLVSVVWE